VSTTAPTNIVRKLHKRIPDICPICHINTEDNIARNQRFRFTYYNCAGCGHNFVKLIEFDDRRNENVEFIE